MTDDNVSRRHFLSVTGAAAAWLAVPWSQLRAAGAHAARAAATTPAPAFAVLTQAEVAALDAMSAHIIPTDDTPGAREANVVRFMDRALATYNKSALPDIRTALVDLDGRVAASRSPAQRFADLDEEQQRAVMKELESSKSDLFEQVRLGTIAGMFADPSYGGNTDKVGWQLIGFEDRFAWSAPFGYYDRDDATSR